VTRGFEYVGMSCKKSGGLLLCNDRRGEETTGPIPLRTQRAGAPTRRKIFLRNYGKQKNDSEHLTQTKQRKTLKKNLICVILNTVAQAANFDTIGGNYYVQI